MDETVNNVSFAENSIGFVDTLEEEKKYFVQAKFENTCKFVEFSEITVASFLNNGKCFIVNHFFIYFSTN